MCHANSNRFLKLYPVMVVVFLNHGFCENTMKFEAVLVYHVSHFLFYCCIRVLLEVVLSDHAKLMKSVVNGAVCAMETHTSCGPVLCRKSLWGSFWKPLQNSHWLVAKHSISTPKVSSFFWHYFIHFANIGRCFTNNEHLKPNLLCTEVTLQSKHTQSSLCSWNPSCSFSLLVFVSFNSKMILV